MNEDLQYIFSKHRRKIEASTFNFVYSLPRIAAADSKRQILSTQFETIRRCLEDIRDIS